MKKIVLKYFPCFAQNVAISIFNSKQYKRRHGGKYKYYREYYKKWQFASKEDIYTESRKRLNEFLEYACKNSSWYSKYCGNEFDEFPVLEKEHVLKHLSEIATVDESKGVACYTGGTTGSSMKVLYVNEGSQDRHAALDHFRSLYGYSLGEKVAWFSGKEFVRPRDLHSGKIYRDDYINKIRFFSTFHINDENFDSYWSALVKFQPHFIVGFPSSVSDLCRLAKTRGLKYKGVVKTYFPTAETVLASHRELVTEVFGCLLADQYASSEGAPFIFECPKGGLHMHTLTGVFEVVDEELKPAEEGELLVTSFATLGTPLIRYRIGDRVRLSPENKKCTCGWNYPMVESIDGRSDDYIYSLENGRVNLGNLSNCTKGVAGIIRFKAIQNEINSITVKLQVSEEFDDFQEGNFIAALKKRVGGDMGIELQYVDRLESERSGKFRIVENTLDIAL